MIYISEDTSAQVSDGRARHSSCAQFVCRPRAQARARAVYEFMFIKTDMEIVYRLSIGYQNITKIPQYNETCLQSRAARKLVKKSFQLSKAGRSTNKDRYKTGLCICMAQLLT